MNNHTETILRKALWKAERLGFRLTAKPGLKVADGVYVALDLNNPSCHPLETVLMGEDAISPRWEGDVARLLNVPVEWVGGFCAGWAGQISADAAHDSAYVDGVQAAADIRKATSRLVAE